MNKRLKCLYGIHMWCFMVSLLYQKNVQFCDGFRNDMCTIYSQILIKINQKQSMT